ncbi:MAG: ribosomal protein S19 family protein [Nanoarchaeota archaeon]
MEMQVKKKELMFKGKTAEELKTLDVREFAKLLRSRQRRTVLRNFQEHENFVKRVNAKILKGKKSVKTHRRDLVIVPGLIGVRIQIYNGKDFIPIDITLEMLGHKLGEFAPTRARVRHVKDGKKKK